MESMVDKPPTAEDENRLIAERRAKLAELREQGPAFPNDFRRSALAGDLQTEFEASEKSELESSDRHVSVAGRFSSDQF